VDTLRATHVHRSIPIVAVDVVSFESLDEGGKGGFESDRSEGVVLDDLFIIYSQELVGDCQYFETY